MEQLLVEATAEVLTALHDLDDLHLVRATVEKIGPDRYRIAGYAPRSLIPELEARGCEVTVVMSAQDIDEFHGEIAAAVAPPDSELGPSVR